ncbi:MAG TPA: hypothetical protein VGK73_06495, partial [Polyangiaceae bacterium]
SPVGILGVNTQAREFPVWLTRDECTLYFGSNRDDGGGTAQTFRLYRATRGAGCTPGVPPDDGNLCTIDTCDPIQGAIHTPVAAGTSCADGNVCDGNEVCNGFGACTSGTPPNLDDANPCTTDGCTQATGIVHAPVSAGTACGDGNVCNGPEQCNATGQCQAGTPLSTDDENPCTLDECDPVNGVSHTPRPAGSNCADEDPCDGEETCSSETECLGIAPEPLPAECQENPPVSTRCGDAIRDPVDEECDDGPGEQIDACAADCRVTDVPVAPLPRVEGERLSRTLGFGRHPLAAAAQATLVTYTELEDSASSLRGAFFQSRGQPSTLIDVGTGALPSEYADASAAAIGPNLFVAAWNDLGHGSLDIALRRLTAGDPPVLGDVVIANTTAGGAQRDPDLVWTGAELVVAWASEFVIIARRFDANLAPLGGEQQLGFSDEIAGSVALTRFGETWAAAWRTIDENSLELLRVHTGAAEWTIGPFLPGAELERPAIVELDSTHLLVVFTEGTDPLATGTPSVSRLRGAILDTTEPGAADWFDLESAVEPHASDGTIVQSRPALARAGTRLFLGWETESLIAGELSSEVWLRELGWNAVALTFATERPLQATLSREDAQHVPAFAATQLIPEGALALAFEEHAEAWP